MPESSENVNDSDSYEEDQDGDTDDLEIGAHFKNQFLQMLKINHVTTAGLLWMTCNQINLFLDTINSHTLIQIKIWLDSKWSYLWIVDILCWLWMVARRILPSISEVDNSWHSIRKHVIGWKKIGRVKKGVFDISLIFCVLSRWLKV